MIALAAVRHQTLKAVLNECEVVQMKNAPAVPLGDEVAITK